MDDILRGGPDADVLWGGMGDDDLSGGGGDDRLIGGPGADTMNGGPGKDIASYADSPRGVHVNMSTTFIDDEEIKEPIRGGDATGDALSSIEVIWGSAFADEIWGTHAHNDLFGNGGSDKLYGERGNDLLRGGDDDDQLWGGDGMDTLYGDMGVDALNGGPGNDLLRGGMDQDILDGGTGDDVLEGGPDADELMGSDHDMGGDTASYTMSPEAVMVDLRHQTQSFRPAPAGGDAMGDTLMGIENLRGPPPFAFRGRPEPSAENRPETLENWRRDEHSVFTRPATFAIVRKLIGDGLDNCSPQTNWVRNDWPTNNRRKSERAAAQETDLDQAPGPPPRQGAHHRLLPPRRRVRPLR